MADERAHHLNIQIDYLTDSIKNATSGESFATVVTAIIKDDLKNIRKRKGEWNFSWKAEYKQPDRKVYKLTLLNQPNEIQGLVSISDMADHFYLHLAESAPVNLG